MPDINQDQDLGIAILIAEFGDDDVREYQPISTVRTIQEARELAAGDMRGRMKAIECGEYSSCPESYVVWARDMDGVYVYMERINP